MSNCYPYIDDKTIYNQLIKLFTKLYNYVVKISESLIGLSTEITLFVTSPLYIIKGYSDHIIIDNKS